MILVTGATGQIGGETARLLQSEGRAVRALVRDAGSAGARALAAAGVHIVEGDQARPATLAAALAGVEAVLVASSNDEGQVEREGNVIAAATAAGARRIVKIAALGTVAGSPISILRMHAAIEERLAASGVEWTSLRPGSFMQNFLRYADSIKAAGVFYGCQGDAPVALIDTRDVAAVAARCLADGGHAGKVYELSGPQALTYADAAAALAAASGRTVDYVDVPPAAARQGMIDAGLPAWLADDLVGLAALFEGPLGRQTTATVATVTGRAPRTFAAFAEEHAGLFRG